MSIAAVSFDLDGTLVDSRGDLAAAANATRVDFGLPPLSLGDVTSMVGEGARRLIERVLGGGADEATVDRALAGFLVHYGRVATATTRPYSGVPELLAALAERVPLAVTTNKPEALTFQLLEALDLRLFFAAVVGGDTFPVRKPDGRVLQFVAGRLGTPVASMIHVGDSRIDAMAAREAGCRFVAAGWGYASDADRRELEGGWIARDPETLARYLLAGVVGPGERNLAAIDP